LGEIVEGIMRVGYAFHGFVGDYKEDEGGHALSTPDGNASYSWSILWEAQRRGHDVYAMQQDRDWPAFRRHGRYDFASFSMEKRFLSYLRTHQTAGTSFPDLDVLLLEWRFPIPGRNTQADIGKPGYQPDLARQVDLLNHYGDAGTRIVLFDLDHKITADDESWIRPAAIFDTSSRPLRLTMDRTRVEIPFHIPDLLQHPTKDVDPSRKLVYVGSRYERDDVIEEWIRPASDRWPQKVEFFGNWTSECNFAEVRAMWPNVRYRDRITMKDFGEAYGTAVACPLIAKRTYLERGFVTARIWEALLFGTLPVGLSSHTGIGDYLPDELIVRDPAHLIDIVDGLSRMSTAERDGLRRKVVEKIDFMDVRNFLDHLEAAAKG
jgi:hypothetical protein